MLFPNEIRNVLSSFLYHRPFRHIFQCVEEGVQTRQIIALLYIAFRHIDSVIAGQFPLVEYESRSAAGVHYCIAAVALKMGKL